jgi:uncharacterized protein with PQ loop repeat
MSLQWWWWCPTFATSLSKKARKQVRISLGFFWICQNGLGSFYLHSILKLSSREHEHTQQPASRSSVPSTSATSEPSGATFPVGYTYVHYIVCMLHACVCVCLCMCVCLYATDLLRMSIRTIWSTFCLLPRAYISLLDDDAIETEDPDLQNAIEASLESASESIRCAPTPLQVLFWYSIT